MSTAVLGSLAPQGFFTPGDVKSEAELLHTAVHTTVQLMFEHSELFDQDFLATWNGFVSDENDFYARAESFFYLIDFADNASRDQVLDLERRYNQLAQQVQSAISSGGDAQAAVPQFSDPDSGDRVQHGALTEPGGPVDEAAGLGNRALNAVKGLTWDVIAAGAVIIGVVVLAVVVVAKKAPGVLPAAAA